MNYFFWNERNGRYRCLIHIFVLMKCQDLNVDTAIDRALFKTDGSGYTFCHHPEAIRTEEKAKLRSDAMAAYEAGKVMDKGKPAGVGNVQQAAMGDLFEGNVVTT